MPDRNENGSSSSASAEERMRAAYQSAESATASAFEQAVGTSTFGAILARSAENVAAISRITSDAADLVLRNLRLAGRADVTRLARQLHRTEDKLERVLQEVEQLRDELAARDAAQAAGQSAASASGTAPASGAGAAPARNGRGTSAKPTPRRRATR